MDKDKAIKESQMKAAINAKLVETGERERLDKEFRNLFFS